MWFDDRLGGNEWALFIHRGLHGERHRREDRPGTERSPRRGEDLPRTTYSNANGRAVFTIDLNVLVDAPEAAGDIIDAFPCLAGSGHAAIQIPMEFRLGSPSELVTEADVSTIQEQAQDHLGLAGTLIDILGISLQGFIDAGAVSALSEAGDAGGKCEITPEHHIRCTKPIKAPSVGVSAAFRINALLPLVDGISLAGDLGMVNLRRLSSTSAPVTFGSSPPPSTAARPDYRRSRRSAPIPGHGRSCTDSSRSPIKERRRCSCATTRSSETTGRTPFRAPGYVLIA